MPKLVLITFLFVFAVSLAGCSSSQPASPPTTTEDRATSTTVPGSAASQSEPKTCTAAEVERVVTRFIGAFNRGDTARLDRLFAQEPGFAWYSTDAPGERLREKAYDRSTLARYFAARHTRGERLRLRSFRFNGNADEGDGVDPYGNFEYGLVRRADELEPTDYYGKGAVRCYENGDVIFVWSMGRQ